MILIMSVIMQLSLFSKYNHKFDCVSLSSVEPCSGLNTQCILSMHEVRSFYNKHLYSKITPTVLLFPTEVQIRICH